MKAILRISKLKTKGNIAGLGSHIARTRETENADPEVENQVGQGSGDWFEDHQKRMDEIGLEKVRKNAVLAVDFMLTASPEYFMKGKERDMAKTAEFCKSTREFMQEKYGDNFVSMTVHLDEKTPHIHAQVVPEFEGKLNARHYFGGREKLSQLQDSFAQSVEKLGLERGEKGSKAKHQSIKKYYSKINKVERYDKANQKLKTALEPFIGFVKAEQIGMVKTGKTVAEKRLEAAKGDKSRGS